MSNRQNKVEASELIRELIVPAITLLASAGLLFAVALVGGAS